VAKDQTIKGLKELYMQENHCRYYAPGMSGREPLGKEKKKCPNEKKGRTV
jgi:hypothetical protein